MAYDEVSPPNPKGTILLLTGLGSNRLAWRSQLVAFGREYRTIALDQRDAGNSFLSSGFYTTADQADDAAAVLQALGVKKAFVVGISMGGMMALQLVVRHPELVAKLVLVSTSAGGKGRSNADLRLTGILLVPSWLRNPGSRDPGQRAVRTYSMITAPGYFQAHPEDAEKLADSSRRLPTSYVAYQRQLRAAIRHDVAGRLHEIKVPTLVIHGDQDRLVPLANGRYLAQHIAGSRLIVYPNTGHILIMERANEFNRDVLAFLH
jgi:pimeloyl-ACP methyl ester carboxylesterase